MTPLFVDFETYYGTGCNLTKLSYSEYITHPDFEVFGAAVAIGSGPFEWVHGKDALAGHLGRLLPNSELVAHNMNFDGGVIAHCMREPLPARYFDTVGAANHLLPNLPHDLESLAEYLGYNGPRKSDLKHGLTKAYNKHWSELTEDEREALIAYALNDGEMLRYCYCRLAAMMPDYECKTMDHTVRLWTDPVLHFDYEAAEDAKARDKRNHIAAIKASGLTGTQLRSKPILAAALHKAMTGLDWEQDFNQQNETNSDPTMVGTDLAERWTRLIRSVLGGEDVKPEKFTPALARAIGSPVPLKYSEKKRGLDFAFAVGDSTFLDLFNKEETRALAEGRKAAQSSIVQSRLKRMNAIADAHGGLMPVCYSYHSAHTGRQGGSNKCNLANLPRDGGLRECLTAPPGHVLVIVDSSNIEARVNAWTAGEAELLELFATGGDPYIDFAQELYDYPLNKKEHKKERGMGKVCVLGLGYGMGADTFRETLKLGPMGIERMFISAEYAQEIVEVYRRKYPRIVNKWHALGRCIPRINSPVISTLGPYAFGHGGVRLPSGRWMRYMNLRRAGNQWIFGARPVKKLYGGLLTENETQATSRDVIMWQMHKVEAELPARVAMHTYDELVAVVKEKDADDVLRGVIDIMSTSPPWAAGLPLAAEGEISFHYKK